MSNMAICNCLLAMAMAEELEVVLLDLWASPFGMRARIALAEKGVRYDAREEDLARKSPLLLESNPVHKAVPVLIHRGKAVCESLNIVEYVDEAWSHVAPLLPKDPYERARARFWARYIDDQVNVSGKKVIWNADGEDQTTSKTGLIHCLKTIEAELGGKPYFGGEIFGFVDVALIPITSWFHCFETCANFSIESECPELTEWAKRCMQRESVAKSLPDPKRLYDYLLRLKEKARAVG